MLPSTISDLLIGGGYVTPAVDAHFKLLVETIQQVEEHGGRLKIFFLQYGKYQLILALQTSTSTNQPTDLAVVSPYPRQLQQASALLKYTLTTLGKQPEQVRMQKASNISRYTLLTTSRFS